MSKKDQFQHNLKKHQRQMKHQREQDQNVKRLAELFRDFGKIYNNK